MIRTNPDASLEWWRRFGVDGKKAFTNFDELWEILNPEKDERKQSNLKFRKSWCEVRLQNSNNHFSVWECSLLVAL